MNVQTGRFYKSVGRNLFFSARALRQVARHRVVCNQDEEVHFREGLGYSGLVWLHVLANVYLLRVEWIVEWLAPDDLIPCIFNKGDAAKSEARCAGVYIYRVRSCVCGTASKVHTLTCWL